MSGVKITLRNDREALLRCFGLNDDGFIAYRKALDGAIYDREVGGSVAALDRVPAILVRLRKAGLSIATRDFDPAVRRALQERSAQEWMDREALKDRIAKIESTVTAARGDRFFPYQRTGARWLASRRAALLADDMGLGKSLQSLVSLPPASAVMVVAPGAVKGNWKAEIEKWRPTLRAEILNGLTSFRWPKPGEILLTNYEILLQTLHDTTGVKGRPCDGYLPPEPCSGCADKIVFVDDPDAAAVPRVMKTRTGHKPSCKGYKVFPGVPAHLGPKGPPCDGCHPILDLAPPGMVLIADEAHALKNMEALRHRRFRALALAVRRKDGYVWGLTGTPLENDPPELWGVLRALCIADEAFGSWDEFAALFNGRKLTGPGGGYAWGTMPSTEVRERLRRVMLRRLTPDVQPDLPPVLEGFHLVELDKTTCRELDEALAASGKTIEEITQLLEEEDVGFELMSSVRSALAHAKIKTMIEIAADFEAREEPLVVFSAHRAPIDRLAKRKGWVVVTGGENAEQKTRAIDAFQNGHLAGPGDRHIVVKNGPAEVKRLASGPFNAPHILYPKGIALTIKAGGAGINLTRAAYMLMVDEAYNPAQNAQAQRRCARIGQRRTVYVKKLVADHPLDRRLQEITSRKTRLICASVDAAADRSDMASAEKGLAAQMRAEQEAIAGGMAVRRGPLLERGELQVLESLGAYVFDNTRDERIAADLAEQAAAIGLSDRQWAFAAAIVQQGRSRDAPTPSAPSTEADAPTVRAPRPVRTRPAAGAGTREDGQLDHVALHRALKGYVFSDPKDADTAADLARQAQVRGLTAKQWQFAAKVVSRGRAAELVEPEKEPRRLPEDVAREDAPSEEPAPDGDLEPSSLAAARPPPPPRRRRWEWGRGRRA